MADFLPPPPFAAFPNTPYPPQSKLFDLAPLPEKPATAPSFERPPTTSGVPRLSYTKSGDGPDLSMPQPTLQRYRRHREYYIDGGDIVFLVSFPVCPAIENRPVADSDVRKHRSKTCFSVSIGSYLKQQVPAGVAESVAGDSYFFERESPVFRKQLTGYGTRERQGGSDADPCVLDGVNVDDFSRFLWVFYNP